MQYMEVTNKSVQEVIDSLKEVAPRYKYGIQHIHNVQETLKSKGIENAIVEIGGELFALGKNTIDNKNWVVGIDDPLQKPEERTLIAKVNLENLGMATSGNYRKVMIDEKTGKKFVHIINPKTGLAQKNNVLSATVLSKSSKRVT